MANYTSDHVSVQYGRGDCTFTSPLVLDEPAAHVAFWGDVDGDGRPDILVGRLGDLLDVRLQNQDGTFSEPTTYALAKPFADVVDLVVRDIDGDGAPDVVVANQGTNVGVLRGIGGGALGPPTWIPTATYPSRVAVADLNADGSLDIVAVNSVSNSVSVVFGHGDGTFAPHVDYPFGVSTNDKAVGLELPDMDGDGSVDMVVSGASANLLAVYLNDGSGSFMMATQIPFTDATRVAVGDVDEDGDLDLVTTVESANAFYVLANTCR